MDTEYFGWHLTPQAREERFRDFEWRLSLYHNTNPLCETKNLPYSYNPVIVHNIHPIQAKLIASPILPACSPSLLPFRTVELVLAKVPIDRIMRLTHPLTKLVSTLHPDLILHHKGLEVLPTDPTRI